MVTAARISLPDFALANPLYADARVSVLAVDTETWLPTTELVTLYARPTGTRELTNPVTLDETGKWQEPVYVDRAVICRVEDAGVPSHDTAVIEPVQPLQFIGAWSPGDTYYPNNIVRDDENGADTNNLYIATEWHVASSSWASDLAAGLWILYQEIPAASDGSFIDPRSYGALGDESHDDTAAIQAALNAVGVDGDEVYLSSGRYLFSAPLSMKSGTKVSGIGALVAAPIGDWAGTPYYGLTNVNNTATSYTDHDITIEGITIDYTALPTADGTRHGIYIQAAERITVRNVTVLGGSSAIALVACDVTLEEGNTLIGFSNCGSDHWAGTAPFGPKNARVVDCHIETTVSAQMLNWNPDGTLGTTSGMTAEGLVCTGNTFISTESPSTPIQIEPLRTGGIVKGVTFTGNTLKGCYLVMRGDTRGAIVEANEFSDFVGTGEAITGYTRNGGTPSDIQIIGNTIRDPLTSVGNVAVIRMESATATIAFNRISGTGYGALPVSVGSTTGQIFGNQCDGTTVVGYLQTGFRIPNGSANYYGWMDNGGGTPRMYCQSSDNNFIFHGTDASGAQRTIWSVIMRSSSSEYTVSVPFLINSTFRTAVTASLAATGSVIGTAAALTANVTMVTSASAGSADGVILSATTGRPQTVINATAVTIKVYPNNSGSSQIDVGGANIPATIAAGKSKTFVYMASADFRTIAST